MCKPTAVFLLLVATVARATASGDATLIVSDATGAAARIRAPVSVDVDLARWFAGDVKTGRLYLSESTPEADPSGRPMPVQFDPETPGSLRGTLRWTMPPGPAALGKDAAQRRFELVQADDKAVDGWEASFGEDRRYVDLAYRNAPVLRYHHGTVPVPEGIDPHYARGDYISLLFGPDGEVLTDDYPRDHPHHRGVSWSWPVTRWNRQVRDIWAVRGVWARPVSMSCSTGPVTAVVEEESVWKWGDKTPIVREQVVIRAFPAANRCRVVDVEVQLTALVDGIAIGGRPGAGYGGFGLRAAPAAQRSITAHYDPAGATPRRAWLDYSGVFDGGKGPAGVAIFEHVTNPDYPSELHQYPACNYVMPAFPGPREVPLSKDKPLLLKHRLWIHPGIADEKTLSDVWATYAKPPKVTIAE